MKVELLTSSSRVSHVRSFVTTLQWWWWPCFVFLYPLFITSLGNQSRMDLMLGKYGFALVALAGGALIEWSYRSSNPNDRQGSNRKTALFDYNSLIVLLFGLWTLVVCIASPVPIIALTGSLYDKTDSSLWAFTLTLCAWLIYLQCKHNPNVLVRVLYAAAFSGGFVSLLALLETIVKHGIVYKVVPSDIPMVSFPQKGHLSGFFVLCFAVALGCWRWNNKMVFVCALLCSFGIGLCFNRASLLAISLTIIFCVYKNWRHYWLISVISLFSVTLGWATVQTFNVDSTRTIASAGTVVTRSYMWKAGINGILEKPFFGWGGGYFYRVWQDKLSFKDVQSWIKLEYGDDLQKISKDIFIVKTKGGPAHGSTFYGWKAHNQFIEVALMYGISGLLLYLLIISRLVIAMTRNNPAALGVVAYHIFFLLWYAIPESDGVLWALIGAGMAGLPAARALETSILEPSPPLHSSS